MLSRCRSSKDLLLITSFAVLGNPLPYKLLSSPGWPPWWHLWNADFSSVDTPYLSSPLGQHRPHISQNGKSPSTKTLVQGCSSWPRENSPTDSMLQPIGFSDNFNILGLCRPDLWWNSTSSRNSFIAEDFYAVEKRKNFLLQSLYVQYKGFSQRSMPEASDFLLRRFDFNVQWEYFLLQYTWWCFLPWKWDFISKFEEGEGIFRYSFSWEEHEGDFLPHDLGSIYIARFRMVFAFFLLVALMWFSLPEKAKVLDVPII